MSFAAMSWLLLLAYALHMIEEGMLDWRDWARGALGLRVEWADFYLTNAVVVVLGIGAAELATELPLLPLAFAALMLINATFFHLLPIIALRGRFSPGAMTAVILLYPAAITAFVLAGREGLLSTGSVLGAFFIGALLMAYPVVMLKARGLAYFRQDPGAVSVDLPALRKMALAFPGVEEGTAYGTLCFRVRKKFIGRTRDGDTVYALPMGIDEREMLIEAEPETFFTTDHYRAWPYVLVRLDRIDVDRLRVYFERAWRAAASKKLLAAYDGDKPPGSS